MKVSSKVVDKVMVITLAGPVDFSARNTLHTLINDALIQGYQDFIVHMQEVTFIDSSGLGTLVACFSTVRKNGGTMQLVQVAKQAYELIEMTRLTYFFEMYDSEEEALENICSRYRGKQSKRSKP